MDLDVAPNSRSLVNYITTQVADERLCQLLSSSGNIQSTHVVLDRVTSRPKGCDRAMCFVNFYCDISLGKEAKNHFNRYKLYNKRLKIATARSQLAYRRPVDRNNPPPVNPVVYAGQPRNTMIAASGTAEGHLAPANRLPAQALPTFILSAPQYVQPPRPPADTISIFIKPNAAY